MEFVSVCSLRLGASLAARGHSLEMKVVVKATFEPTHPGERRCALELAAHQPAPEGDERALIDDEAALSRAVRRLRGVEVGPRRWVFEGAPPGMEIQELPELAPRLFIVQGGGSREVMLGTRAVELNPVTGWVTALWADRASLARAESAGTIVLAMETADELVTWEDVLRRTRGLDASFVEQRGRAIERALAPTDEAPLEPAPEPEPPKRSIGQMMIDMPRPRPRPSVEEDAPSAPPADARRSVLGHEVLWVADAADAALRKHPILRKLLPKKSAEDEMDRPELEVGGVALRGPTTDLDALGVALRASVSDGVLEPPLVIVSGELSVAVDPVEALRAWAVNALAAAPNDESVKAAASAANEALDGADTAAPLLVALLAKLRASVAVAAGAPVEASLDAGIRRGLVRERRTQRVTLRLGLDGEGEHVRATLAATSAVSSSRPERVEARVYLPVAAAARLPLVATMEVRLVARVHPPLQGRAKQAPVLLPLAILRAFSVETDAVHSMPSAAPARIVTP